MNYLTLKIVQVYNRKNLSKKVGKSLITSDGPWGTYISHRKIVCLLIKRKLCNCMFFVKLQKYISDLKAKLRSVWIIPLKVKLNLDILETTDLSNVQIMFSLPPKSSNHQISSCNNNHGRKWGLSRVDFGQLTSCKFWLIFAICLGK